LKQAVHLGLGASLLSDVVPKPVTVATVPTEHVKKSYFNPIPPFPLSMSRNLILTLIITKGGPKEPFVFNKIKYRIPYTKPFFKVKMPYKINKKGYWQFFFVINYIF
jgi:hypothetical protein